MRGSSRVRLASKRPGAVCRVVTPDPYMLRATDPRGTWRGRLGVYCHWPIPPDTYIDPEVVRKYLEEEARRGGVS